MQVGDVIRCGEEKGIVISTQDQPPGVFDDDFFEWLTVFWEVGDIEGISVEDVDEVISETKRSA